MGEEIKEGFVLKDELVITHRDKDGNVVSEEHLEDLIVNKGKEFAAKLLNGVSTNPFDYIQIGEGTTPPVVGDTAMEDQTNKALYEDGEKFASVTYVADYKARLSCTFSFTGSVSITESGVMDRPQGESPNMLCRRTFGAKNMNDGEALGVIWTITIGTV